MKVGLSTLARVLLVWLVTAATLMLLSAVLRGFDVEDLAVALGEKIEDGLQRRALLLGTGDQQVESSGLLLRALTLGAGEFQQFEHLILSRERTRRPFTGQPGADS